MPDTLVGELLSVDGFTTGTVAGGSITTPHHEPFDNAVELVALVRGYGFFLARAEDSEVLSRDGSMIGKQLEHDTSFLVVSVALLTNSNVKEGLGVGRVEFGQSFDFLVLLDMLGLVIVHITSEEVRHLGSFSFVVLGDGD